MIKYTKIRDVKDPVVGTAGSAGIDFFIPNNVVKEVKPFDKVMIPLGIKVILPRGHVMLMQDKSGVANKLGLHVIAGVIDADYRGEIHACFINPTPLTVQLFGGDKIIQGVVVQYINQVKQLNEKEYEEASENWGHSTRGTKGFGHGTGGTHTTTYSDINSDA